jgi:hypothetical protein
MPIPRLCDLACTAVLIPGLLLAARLATPEPTPSGQIDPCALVSASSMSAIIGKRVAAGRPDIQGGEPAGFFLGTCMCQGQGVAVSIGVKQYPSAALAKKDFAERLSLLLARQDTHQPKIIVDHDVADGAYWTPRRGSYWAIRGHRWVWVTMVGTDTTTIASVPHARLESLVMTALSK